ncbi:MAG: hypothetical protein ABL973_06500 [Micropepsaceae bacterium]
MSESSHRSLWPSPLHARTAELCATNQWFSFGGFTVPAVYSSEQEESEALIARVGIFDLSARQSYQFEGPDAGSFLGFVTSSDVASLEAGQTTRALWCDDDGCARGEGQVIRYGKAQYELSTSVRDFAWFTDGARGFDVKVSCITGQRAGIGVRGPLAMHLLGASGFSASQGSKGETGAPASAWRQAQVALLRDATGEGFELWCHADDGIVVWDRLVRMGAAFGVSPVGASVLEVARVEGALPLAGIDWLPSQLAKSEQDLRWPRDLGLQPVSTRRFNGSQSVHRSSGPGAYKAVQLTSHEVLVPGPLLQKGAGAGKITSSAWSPGRERAFAIAWLKTELAHSGIQFQGVGRAGVAAASFIRDCYL